MLARTPRAPFTASVFALALVSGLAVQHAGTAGNALPAPASPHARKQAQDRVASQPLSFEANRGQSDSRVRFQARSGAGTLFLTPDEAVLALAYGKKSVTALHTRFVGANSGAALVGESGLPGKVNYLIGRDSAKWQRNVPTYARVRYEDLYPGTDLVYYGREGSLEYDFVVAPGASPSAIGMRFEGADKVRLDRSGDLVLKTRAGELHQRKPVAYQEADGKRQPVDSKFKMMADGRVGFEVGAYDRSRALVIDPTFVWGTFLGGSGDDSGTAIAHDASGFLYVGGYTSSVNFPNTFNQTGSAITTLGFVSKIKPDGSAFVYSTYVGATSDCMVNGIAVDSSGSAYIAGAITGSGFPTTAGAFQHDFIPTPGNGSQSFVAKLAANGSSVVYGTYLCDTNGELETNAIAIDGSGNAYLTGTTSDSLPKAPGVQVAQPNYGGFNNDAFVIKLNSTGTALVYSTYLGGNDYDYGFGIVVDSTGAAYVTGSTGSPDFPTTGGVYTTEGAVFVTKVSPSGGSFLYSTHFGGGGYYDQEQGKGIAIDGAGRAYVTGYTRTAYPTTANLPLGLSSVVRGSQDAFISVLGANGSSLVFSALYGGALIDIGNAIALDDHGCIFVVGATNSGDLPQINAIMPSYSGAGQANIGDAFLVQLKPIDHGGGILQSTYLGGLGDEEALAVTVNNRGDAYLTGYTNSPTFPHSTSGVIQSTLSLGGGGEVSSDAFVVRIQTPPPAAPTNLQAVAVNSHRVDLSWSESSTNITGFVIERKLQGGTYQSIGSVGPNTLTYSDLTVLPSTSYVYRVTALGECTDSDPSSEAQVTTPASPPVPTNLQASATSATSVHLTWSLAAGSSDAGVKIERKLQGGSFAEITTTAAHATSYDDNGVTANNTYVYQVRTTLGGENSGYSNQATVSTGGGTPPAAPTNLVAANLAIASIRLTWTLAGGSTDTGIKVERKLQGGSYSQLAVTDAHATSYSDNGVALSTTYVYRVRATNGFGDSDYSNEFTITSLGLNDLPAPSGLTASATSSTTVHLAWVVADTSLDTGIKVERKSGSGAYTQIKLTASHAMSFDDSGLTAGTTYTYRVRATNGTNDSDYSNEASVTTPAVGAPGTPKTLVATATGTGSIHLTWVLADALDKGVKIERKTGGGSFTQIAQTAAHATSADDSGLAGNTTYTYRLRATNTKGDSGYSNEASATTFPPAPGAPSELTAVATSAANVHLAWTLPSGSTDAGVKVERKLLGGDFAQIQVTGAHATSFDDGSVLANLTYVYRVRSTNAAGDSAYSNEATATTPTTNTGTPPNAPSGLTATAKSAEFVVLGWTIGGGGETGFQIERKTGSGSYNLIAIVAAGVHAYSDSTGLTASATYTYRVRAVNGAGASEYSNEATATTTARGVLKVTPPKISFGTITDPSKVKAKLVKISNSGPGPVTVRVQAPAAPFTMDAKTVTLAAKGTLTLSIGFNPTVKGTYATTIQITSDATNNQVPVAVTGGRK